jgi:hypothetical protein
MQPYFFPYIGYWQLMRDVDRFIVYDDVNFITRGWINRNRVLDFGKPSYLTVPLCHSSPNKRICDITMNASTAWRDKLVRKVELTYRRSPSFTECFPLIERLIRHDTDSLAEYLANQLEVLSAYLGIQTTLVPSSRCYGNDDLSGQARVIDICKREGASEITNPHGGRAMYDRLAFAENGVNIRFLVPSKISYKQFGTTHVPQLSVIDALMFNSRAQMSEMLDSYELVE